MNEANCSWTLSNKCYESTCWTLGLNCSAENIQDQFASMGPSAGILGPDLGGADGGGGKPVGVEAVLGRGLWSTQKVVRSGPGRAHWFNFGSGPGPGLGIDPINDENMSKKWPKNEKMAKKGKFWVRAWSGPLQKHRVWSRPGLITDPWFWVVKTVHRMRGCFRKRRGVTQSSFTWRNSRRIPPGASGGHWTGGEEVTAYVEGWSGTLHVAQLTDQRPNKTYHHTVKPSNNTRKRTNTFSHPPLTSEKLPTQCQTYQQPQKTSQHAVKPTNNPRKHTKTVSYLPTTPEILLTLWKLTNSISTNVLGRGSTPVRWVLVFFSALCKL